MKVKHFLIILFASLIIIPGTSKAARVWTYFDVNNNQLQSPSDKEIKELAVKRVSNDNVTQYLLDISHDFSGTQSAGYLETIGNATPEVGQHWVNHNEIIACQIAGIAKDAAAVNSRYISVGYLSQGAPNITGNVHALQFDGVGAYVSAPGLSLAYGNSWSIEFWAKRDELGRKDTIISQGDFSAYKGIEAGFTDTNTFIFSLPYAGTIETQAFEDLYWHRWKCRYLRYSKWVEALNDYAYVTTLYLYRDTVEVGKIEFVSNHYHSSKDTLNIGKGLTGDFFKGRVKSVVVKKDGKIIADWPLDDNSDLATDKSGTSHTAKLINFSGNYWIDDPSIAQAYDFSQILEKQEIPQFKMATWAKITYVWSRQFLVTMNTSMKSMVSNIKIDILDDSGQPSVVGEGQWWYEDGTAMRISAQSNPLYDVIGYVDNLATLTYETDILLINELKNELNITWNYAKHIYEIQTQVGSPVSLESIPSSIISNLTFKEPMEASTTNSSNAIDVLDPNAARENASTETLYLWSEFEKKIYPLIGDKTFSLEWDAGTMGSLVTTIKVVWPPDYYIIPHIAETPPVTLDSSTEDIVTFKEIKYIENDAGLSNDNDGFNATTNGKSVLMFSRQFSQDIVPKDVALKFDGFDDYVDLGQHIDIDENNFTVEFWAQRAITETAQMILSQDPDAQRRGLQLGFNQDNTFSFGYYGDLLTTSTAYTDTNWHHWACSYESVLPDPDVKYGPKVISIGFDGVDDYVDVTDPMPLGDEFTIEFWSKTNGSGFQTVVGQGIRDTNKGLHIGFLDDNRFTFGFYNNDLITDDAYPDIAWHHWACSYKNMGPYQIRDISLSFDGLDDYVEVPADVWFSGDFTIESWVYLKRGQPHSRIIDFGNGPGTDNVLLSISNDWNGKPYLFVGDGTKGDAIVGPMNFPIERWAHIAATLEGSTAKIFINGKEVVSKELTTIPANVNRTKCFIGKSNWASNSYFWGGMDDVRIWNRALPAQELNDQMDTQLQGTESGLVGYWRFNESKGRIAKDSSGNEKDGTLINMEEPPWVFENPEPVVTSKPKDRFIEFDGVNDKVNLGGNINLTNKSFSIEFWAKRASIGRDDFIISQGSGSNNNAIYIGFRQSDYFSFGFWNGDTDSATTYTDTDWHHWAVTYDSTNKARKVYRDGVEVGSGTSTSHYLGTGDFFAGGLLGWYYKGALDDLRVWDSAISQDQILNNKDIELTGSETGLLAYWKFNEESGFAVYDSTSNKNNGVLVNIRANPFKPYDINPLDITSFPWYGNLIPSMPKERTFRFTGMTYTGQYFPVWMYHHYPGAEERDVHEATTDKWTVELWFKAEKITGENILYNKEYCYTGSIRDGYFQYAWSPHWAWVQGFPVEANKWYHAAVVYDGATQKVYKNGKKEFERTQIGAITQNGYGLVLGDRPSYAAPFKGEIDEVRVWSTART
jgi:hypothetical protein